MPLPLLSEPRDGAFTFGEPDTRRPFTALLADAFSTDKAIRTDMGTMFGFAGEAGDDIARMARVARAAERTQVLVDNTYARGAAIEEAIDNRIAAVQRATGVTLENYARIPPTMSTMAGFVDDPRPDDRRADFHRRLRELAAAHPDQAGAIRPDVPIEDDAREMARAAEENLQLQLGDPELGGVAGFSAALIGGLQGTFRDPLQDTMLFAGGGPAKGATIAARIGWASMREGLINAGAVALSQPAAQSWREEAGLRAGIMPALENVGLAFLFGAVLGGPIQGLLELKGPARAAVENVVAGHATPADVREAVNAVGGTLSDADKAALRAIERENDAAIAGGEPLPGVPREIHDDVTAQAIAHAENPAGAPPPEIAIAAPARRADQVRVIDETLPAAPGDRETVDGKPVTFERFDPRTLTSDAATFQFKGGGDAQGVTDRLRFVTQWDPLASGKSFVFERADGARVVADGHQRLGLAKRLTGENADAAIRLDGYLFREADGWTPADVRALAAKKNLQEGSGEALDAAKILRERPDILDGALPITGPMMKSAIALSRLSDEAFGMTTNGVVPENYAAAVGAMVPDPLQHAAVMADLARFKPETEREARLLIGEVMAAGFRADEQISLFGAAETTRSLMAERVRTLDAALSALVRDKKLFGTLAAKAETIEAAGNVLARGTNEQRAADAAALADTVSRLARRTGPVSDALNRAAAQVAEGMKARDAADGFLDELRGILDRDGLPALLASPDLKPRVTVEPGTPEAVAVADAARAQRVGPGAALPPEVTEVEPGVFTIPIADTAGKEVGVLGFHMGEHGAIVRMAAINDETARGKGAAVAAYQKLADWTLARGQQLWSDRNVTPEASRVYDALERRGYVIVRDENSTYATTRGVGFNGRSPGVVKVIAGPGKEGLERMLAGDPTPDQVMAHPVVRDAIAHMEAIPKTGTDADFKNPEFRAARVFDVEGERIVGYDAAIARLVQKAESYAGGPVARQRHATIVIGPPAAGKSTFSEELARQRHAAIIDADDAKAIIPEYQGGIGAAAVHEESSVLSKSVLARAIADDSNLVIPKIGDDAGRLREIVKGLQNQGYAIDLLHVNVPPDEALRRNLRRFLATGRLVPPNYFAAIGEKPREAYYLLKREGILNDSAEIDASGPRGSEQKILDGNGQLAELVRNGRSGPSPHDGSVRGSGSPEGRAQEQTDLIDAIAVSSREDGKDARFISRADALAEADKPTHHADLVKDCKT